MIWRLLWIEIENCRNLAFAFAQIIWFFAVCVCRIESVWREYQQQPQNIRELRDGGGVVVGFSLSSTILGHILGKYHDINYMYQILIINYAQKTHTTVANTPIE